MFIYVLENILNLHRTRVHEKNYTLIHSRSWIYLIKPRILSMVDPMFIQSNKLYPCVWGRDNEFIEGWLRVYVTALGHNVWRQDFTWNNDNFTCSKMMTILSMPHCIDERVRIVLTHSLTLHVSHFSISQYSGAEGRERGGLHARHCGCVQMYRI